MLPIPKLYAARYVSEGEIRDAIRRGATTLDGVAAYAPVGRCQGYFAEIIIFLSRDRSATGQITKRSSGSPLLAGRLRSAGRGAVRMERMA